MEHGKAGTTAQAAVRRLRWSLLSRYAALLLATVILGSLLTPCFADEPAPDPSGTATGGRTTTTDAAGNPFVVPAPPDPSAPDYAQKKKDYDEFQAQLAKGTAGRQAGRQSGPRPNSHELLLDPADRISGAVHAGRLCLADMRIGAQEKCCPPYDAELCGLRLCFLAYYAVVYALQFGAVAINAAPANLGGTPTLNHFLLGTGLWGFLGGKGFFLSGPGYDAGSLCLTLFEVVFMETAGYIIIVGAICERITFWSFLLCELFMGAILYPAFGCWVWGGGWLSQLGTTRNLGHGYVDFAGSTVVHAVEGFAAMALSVILGPRLGKYGPDGKVKVFPAHTLVYVVTGTFILLFGWMGFNPGSTLGASDLRISVIAVNTNLAAVAGSAAAMFLCTSCLANPTSPWLAMGCWPVWLPSRLCAFVSPNSALVIGILAGVVVCLGVLFNDRVVKIDDPCGAISVHGYCGWLGAVCVGLFADGTYGAGWNGVGASSYLGHAGSGCHRFVSWRHAAAPHSTDGRHHLCGLGIWCDLCGFRFSE